MLFPVCAGTPSFRQWWVQELAKRNLPAMYNLSVYPYAMNKKEIESPKLTINFLVWISAFMLLLFALLAHFVWKIF